MTCLKPTAAPREHSARAPRSASLATRTSGSTGSRFDSRCPRGTSCQRRFGRQVDEAITAAYDPGHGHSRPHQLRPRRRPAHELAGQTADGATAATGVRPASQSRRWDRRLVDLAAEAHAGHGQGIGPDLDSQRPNALGGEADEQGGAPGGALRRRRAFRYQADRGQLTDEGADGAAVEPRPGGELRSG